MQGISIPKKTTCINTCYTSRSILSHLQASSSMKESAPEHTLMSTNMHIRDSNPTIKIGSSQIHIQGSHSPPRLQSGDQILRDIENLRSSEQMREYFNNLFSNKDRCDCINILILKRFQSSQHSIKAIQPPRKCSAEISTFIFIEPTTEEKQHKSTKEYIIRHPKSSIRH